MTDITDQLATTNRDAIETITRLRLALWETRSAGQRLAGALRGVIDYGPVAQPEAFDALHEWDTTNGH